MRAIPQLKTQEIVEQINALQLTSPYFLDVSTINAFSQKWIAIKKAIEPMFKVDACIAWELTGAHRALTGDWDGMNVAFRNSVAIGNTGTNRLNWAINCVHLGMFSAGHEAYETVGDPDPNFVNVMLRIAIILGAIQKAARFVERAREMNITPDIKDSQEVKLAQEMLRGAGISEAQIAQHLDVAGAVLRRHNIRPTVLPRVAAAEGFFNGVTFALAVPVTAAEAFEMNIELAMEEEEAGIRKELVFDVVFEAAAA